MRKHKLLLLAALALGAPAILLYTAGAGATAQQETSVSGSAPMLTVSAEPRHGTELAPVSREDVMVLDGRDRDAVLSWTPARGDRAGLELLVLIDDGSSMDLTTQFKDLQTFMQKQPPTTLIAVGYSRNGMVEMVHDFTTDHAAAAKTLRLPMGIAGVSGSPYFALQDLSKHWPANNTNPRHEVLLISSGIDPNYSGGLVDPYVNEAVSDLQRAGVVAYAIYQPGAGHAGHSFWRINMGQSYLSQLCEETGGESYYIGSAPAVAFAPYLEELDRQLQRQYLLTFTPKPRQNSGFQSVRVTTELSNVDLVAADRVYVPAVPK